MEKVVEFNNKNYTDGIGRLFYYNNAIYRLINEDRKDFVKELFSNGLIKELEEKALIIPTKISQFHIHEDDLILEHEKIEIVTYDHEWSFSMRRDVALTIIKIQSILMDYGYELWDCHNYNFGFYRNHPVLLDFGSIRKDQLSYDFGATAQFLECQLYPLKMYEKSYSQIVNAIAKRNYDSGEMKELYWRILHPLKSLKIHKIIEKLKYIRNAVYSYYLEENLGVKSERTKTGGKYSEIKKFIKKYSKYNLLSNSKRVNHRKKVLQKWEKNIIKIKWKEKSRWGEYYDDCGEWKKSITPRFITLSEIVKNNCKDIESVWEWGGNEGVFAQLLLENIKSIRNYLVSDYDQNAIDNFYKRNKNEKITPFVYDVMRDSLMADSQHNLSCNEDLIDQRFSSDLLVAMALTHHLILSQMINIDRLVDMCYRSTKRYLLIEFMPLGLYYENAEDEIDVPEFYTEEWFLNSFLRKFQLKTRVQTEPNRVAFLFEKEKNGIVE